MVDRRPSLLRRLTGTNLLDDGNNAEDKNRLCGKVNVEPVILLIGLMIGFLVTSQPLFTYWARCVEIANHTKLYENDNVTALCASLTGSNDTFQDVVERDIATTKIYLQIASSIPTLIMSPVIGVWSDKRGRKAPLIFAMSGAFIYCFLLLCSILTYEAISVYYWYFAAEFINGLTGGSGTMFATMFTIVADDSRHKLRPGSSTVPLRIGIASFLQSFGTLMGTFVVSLLAVPAVVNIEGHKFSYVQCGLIQATLSAMALIYAIFFVKETHFPQKECFSYNEFDEASNDDENEIEITQPKGFAAKMKKQAYATVSVLLERRAGWTRLCLCMSMFFIFVEFLALDNSLIVLLIKRQPFSWTDTTFSQYTLLKGIMFSIGMVLVPLSLTRVHWLGKDSLMIVIGISASAASFFLIALANNTNQIFATAFMGILCGGISPGFRSFLPRMVSKEETARLFTVIAIVLAFTPILSSLIFNEIFNFSLSWWPAFAFLIGGLLQVVVVFGQIAVHLLMIPQWQMEQRLKEQRRIQAALEREEDDNNDGNNDASGGASEDRSVSNTAVGSDQPNTDLRS